MIENKMLRKGLVIGIIVLLVGVNVFPSISGTIGNLYELNSRQSIGFGLNRGILYVGGDGPGNYTKIQYAIDDANPGDTVFVYNGTYFENIKISKDNINLIGENKNNTIINGNYIDNTIEISASIISISSLQIIKGSLTLGGGGIQLYNAKEMISNISIINCVINENNKAIDLVSNCSNIIICNCEIYNNRKASIVSWCFFSNILIDNCKIYNNGDNSHNGGITLEGYSNENLSSNIIISNCTIYENYQSGIRLEEVENVIIQNNKIFNTLDLEDFHFGIYLNVIRNIKVFNNKIFNNSRNGIYIVKYNSNEFCSNITIKYNNFTNNGGVGYYNAGISLHRVTGATIIQYNIFSSNSLGIDVFYSTGIKIFNNTFIDNVKHVYFIYYSLFHFNRWKGNYWDKPRELPYPIIGTLRVGLFFEFLALPWINFDWRPARESYDI